jgi:transcriptional regulator with GAF, ATPase, and Fis domain
LSSLLTIKGYGMGVRYRLADVTTIGRDPENTIQLLDEAVSRVHAEIRRQRLAYTLHDKGSKEGVFVNGKPIQDKLLRRNDEIAIGATHFLFDSDFDVKSTLFSNKTVYMSAPADPTASRVVDEGQIESADEYRRGGLGLLERISDLLAAPRVELPKVSEEVLASIVEMTGAGRAAIFRWDSTAAELVPLAVHCSEDQLTLDRGLLAQAFKERKAILSSDVPLDLRYAENPGASNAAISVICVPVGSDARCDGVIYVDSEKRDQFSLRDVAMLLAVGRLFHLAIQVAGLHDRFEGLGAAPTEMIGASSAIRAVREQAARVARHDTPVLITGETGTGKELLAREIHAGSTRKDGPFVALNCSAIPQTLFESELFGHEKGAFTGAIQLTRGKIETASGGTLFLDEVGEMSLEVQPKLLRFLQDQVFYRVGGTRPVRSSVRVVAATNADLRRMVEQGRFRSDLMFRLNVIELQLPPLRERGEDIPLLAEFFLKRIAREIKKPVRGVTEEAMRQLARYPWPGNIRELNNCLERAVLLADGPVLDLNDFEVPLGRAAAEGRAASGGEMESPGRLADFSGQTLAAMERAHILAALERNDWNQGQTARALGIHRNTLRNKIHEYGLKRPGG